MLTPPEGEPQGEERRPGTTLMRCRVCGNEFDPFSFQIVIPGRPESFDRVECAIQAYSLARSETHAEIAAADREASLLRPVHLRPVV